MLAVLCTRMILAQRAILSISVYPQFVGSFVHSFSSVVIAPTLYIPLRRACSFSRRAPRFEWAEPTKRRWFSAIQRFLLLLLFGAAVIAAGVAEAAAAAVFVVDHLESLSGFFDIHLSDYAYVSGGNISLNEEKKGKKNQRPPWPCGWWTATDRMTFSYEFVFLVDWFRIDRLGVLVVGLSLISA